MINTDRLTEWEKQTVITFLMSKLTEDARHELKHALPLIYNKLIGTDVMEVTQRKTDVPSKRGAAALSPVAAGG